MLRGTSGTLLCIALRQTIRLAMHEPQTGGHIMMLDGCMTLQQPKLGSALATDELPQEAARSPYPIQFADNDLERVFTVYFPSAH